MMLDAINLYRERFEPSAQLKSPYLMLGFNIYAANTMDEAIYLRSSGLQSFLRMQAGKPSQLPPPMENFEATLDPTSKNMLKTPRIASAYGDHDRVKEGLQKFVDETQADEVIVVCQIYDHAKRLRSYEIAAEVADDIESRTERPKVQSVASSE